MEYELEEIKKLRKKHSLTQVDLARLANVSQSLIAKIESGNLDPSYSKVRKILQVLNNLTDRHEAKADDFMQRRIVSCARSELVTEAAKKMRKYEISQLPVIERDHVIGLVAEADILEHISDGAFTKIKVEEIMEAAPPVIAKKTPMKVVLELLRFSPLLLVSESGEYVGIITKSDVLKKI